MTKTNSRIKQSASDRMFDIVNYFLLSLLLIIFIFPLWFVIVASVSDPYAVWRGEVFVLPVGFSLSGYRNILNYRDIWIGYGNSLYYTVVGTVINLIVTFSAAYPLSRREFLARGFLMKLYTFTMYFSGGLIPSYLLMRSLNLINTRWAMLLPGAMSVWNLIVTRTFLQSNIPQELYEAAYLDGCNEYRMLYKIVLPLSAPIIAVIALFYGVSHWNAYFGAMIYLTRKPLFPLQLILREILVMSQMPSEMVGTMSSDAYEFQRMAESVKYGVIVVASLPVLAIYPLVQKHFVKGVMIGSIKG